MSTNPVERAVEALGDEATPTTSLVASILAAGGKVTLKDLAEMAGVSEPSAHQTISTLASRGCVERAATIPDGQGRSPDVYRALPPLAPDEDTTKDKREAIVEILAREHWIKGISSARSKDIARHIEEMTTTEVAMTLSTMKDNGVVERLNPGSVTARWRLVGAGEYAPYRAGTKESRKEDQSGDQA